MPVLRSVTEWRTRTGKVRRIRLYSAWVNMRGRLSGRIAAGNGSTPWVGLPCDFKDWRDFRAWALANGYSRFCNSLDRYPFPSDGYIKENLRWVPVSVNTGFQNCIRRLGLPTASSDLPW